MPAPEFTWANCPPNAIETFPGTYEELFSYNAVVLSDVNYKAVGDIGFEMIRDYVEQGGRLLVTGGPYAFGDGEFEDTRFLDVLPVELSGPFDLKWAGKGQIMEIGAGGQPVLILGKYGQGKVAVLTLSPTGISAKGETAWWDWDGWGPLVKNIFAWLTTN